MLTTALGLFAVAAMLALVEIEIEGKFGWGEKIPTWYRTTGFSGRVYGFLTMGKPLTGYLLFVNALLLMALHLRFFESGSWSIDGELTAIARFFALAVVWDFLWFVFNPYYTIKRFKRENIWWFAKSRWVFGFFPVDYVYELTASMCLSLLSGLVGHNALGAVKSQLSLIGLLLLFSFVAVILSPLYRRWYATMRKRDDRDKSGIFHH